MHYYLEGRNMQTVETYSIDREETANEADISFASLRSTETQTPETGEVWAEVLTKSSDSAHIHIPATKQSWDGVHLEISDQKVFGIVAL